MVSTRTGNVRRVTSNSRASLLCTIWPRALDYSSIPCESIKILVFVGVSNSDIPVPAWSRLLCSAAMHTLVFPTILFFFLSLILPSFRCDDRLVVLMIHGRFSIIDAWSRTVAPCSCFESPRVPASWSDSTHQLAAVGKQPKKSRANTTRTQSSGTLSW